MEIIIIFLILIILFLILKRYQKNKFDVINFIPLKSKQVYYNVDKTKLTHKIKKCFLITMQKSKKRYNSFLRQYNQNCNLPLEIIWSVDTKNPEVAEKYKHLVTQEKYQLMKKFDTGEAIRPDHSYFNSGALGCYLGHMEFYKRCFEQNLDYAIVFEDNVIIGDTFMEELNELLNLIETNDLIFDVIFLHCWSHIGQKLKDVDITKLKWTMSAKCYLVNVNNMKKHHHLFYPIDTHVDLAYEKLIYLGGANVYLKNFKSFDILQTISNIGHTNVLNNEYVQYFDKDVQQDMVICNV